MFQNDTIIQVSSIIMKSEYWLTCLILSSSTCSTLCNKFSNVPTVKEKNLKIHWILIQQIPANQNQHSTNLPRDLWFSLYTTRDENGKMSFKVHYGQCFSIFKWFMRGINRFRIGKDHLNYSICNYTVRSLDKTNSHSRRKTKPSINVGLEGKNCWLMFSGN